MQRRGRQTATKGNKTLFNLSENSYRRLLRPTGPANILLGPLKYSHRGKSTAINYRLPRQSLPPSRPPVCFFHFSSLCLHADRQAPDRERTTPRRKERKQRGGERGFKPFLLWEEESFMHLVRCSAGRSIRRLAAKFMRGKMHCTQQHGGRERERD